MTKTSLKLLLLPLLAAAIFLPFSAKAFSVKTGDAININQSEVIDGNLYAAGSTLLIDGEIKGDVICAGQSITISGKVDGDVICAGQSINILGEVAGSVRVAGNSINIDNKVGRNVMAFGASSVLGSKGEVGMDMLTAASFVNINGKIAGNLHGSGSLVTINGQIGKDVAFKLDTEKSSKKTTNLTITENAKIGGNLEYTSALEAKIAKDGLVAGKTSRQLPKMSEETASQNLFLGMAMFWLWCKIIGLFGTLLIGLLLVICFKEKLLKTMDDMVVAPGKAIAWGALFLFVGPVMLFLIFLTMIGIPLAFLLALIWLAALILGKVMVSIFVGLLIMGRYRHKPSKNNSKTETTGTMILSMIVGVVITCALFTIPLFGWALALIAKMWGLGVMWLSGKKCCHAK